MSREADVQRMSELMSAVMRGSHGMTERQIARAIYRRARIETDVATVRAVLRARPGRFTVALRRFPVFPRAVRWRLVEAGPASDPGTSGAGVPARPILPLRSGAAAAVLTFRDEDPPPRAIGRLI